MIFFRKKIKDIPFLGTYIKKIYKFWFPDVQSLISKNITNKYATILQIGSNDGKTGDPIFPLILTKRNWKAIFVEPVPFLFNRLKQNYGTHSRFVFENVAINDGNEQVFYFVKQEAIEHLPELPIWYDQLGSFNKDNILKHLDGILEQFIEEITLQGITLNNLLEKNSITSLDLLHIDAEGYDWKILRQLNLKHIKPTIILFEHKHLDETEKILSVEFLKNDYYIFIFGSDYISIKKEIVKSSDLKKLRNMKINIT